MKSLKVLAHLLDYPSAEMRDARVDMIRCLKSEAVFGKELLERLVAFADELCTTDLLEAQEAYVATFDRGRSVSLLLFEHVHGESRDRGQAMVNLMTEYEKAGLELDARELPDHLPLFLEFLSTRSEENIHQWIVSIEHIIALLSERLKQRDSAYAVLFDAMLDITGSQVDESLSQKVASEVPDNTPEALDKVWEEEMVQFMGADATASCGDSGVIKQRREELGRVQTLHVQDFQKAV